MISNRLEEKHWFNVSIRFVTDLVLFVLSFVIAMQLRFDQEWVLELQKYGFGIVVGALAFSSGIYMFGFYHLQDQKYSTFKRSFILGILHLAATIIMMIFFYISMLSVVGRGVMMLGTILSYCVVWLHHWFLIMFFRNISEKVAVIIASKEDEETALGILSLDKKYFEIAGFFTHDYTPQNEFNLLGTTENITDVAIAKNFDRVLVPNPDITRSDLHKTFCKLRYSGIAVIPMIAIYEEFFQTCPIRYITSTWFLNASTAPHLFYIRKIKRVFDVITALTGLILSSPILLIAMILVKLTSKGPIFYKQVRVGRFDQPFTLFKLRSMKVDAEKDGAVWAAGKDDPRTTIIGKYLRKFRIDELPQFINVLRGDMSFVGPRPERPEFCEILAEKIPFYQERHLVQPGITGWAQVNYPYGNNVEDSRKKLEYDLYYIKHMSLFLDIFILLDTIGIVLVGGLDKSGDKQDVKEASKA